MRPSGADPQRTAARGDPRGTAFEHEACARAVPYAAMMRPTAGIAGSARARLGPSVLHPA